MHLDNWLFFLLVAVAMLFRWLASAATKAGKGSNEPQQRPQASKRSPEETDAERMRKFLEALGAPPGTAPPRRVEPRTQVPPRPLVPVQPPREMAPPVFRRSERQQPAQPVTKSEPPPLPAIPYDVRAAAQPPPAPERSAVQPFAALVEAGTRQTRNDIIDLLRSPGGLRNAVMLREILGPPRAFSTLSELS